MKQLLLSAALFVSAISFSQVGIGTNNPNASAQLDVTGTSKGFLPPRMSYLQREAIEAPAAGLEIWCTNCGTNGEMQVYNGTAWTNISGTAASFAKPVAPTSPIATALYKQASIAFLPPASNGGSAITGYTVTSDPGGFTATGENSPITVSGLTNGTSYTFTVVATNAGGNSVASEASMAVMPNCGAYIASGIYKTFACFNLGAYDTTGDPNVPSRGTNGSYYQWGRNAPAAIVTATEDAIVSTWGSQGGNGNSGNWTSIGDGGTKNPCPTGFRVPSKTEWDGVIDSSLNTVSRTGSWANDANFTTAISFGPSESDKTLTLPAAGYRPSGTLSTRGIFGWYWTSTENTGTRWALVFHQTAIQYSSAMTRDNGVPVRCISQ